ncbi:MAG: hypothetical protein QE263_08805 [Vampirovibrionales bacterium]|nr:hypothetical protein [Vampirovibrionales bacterium]
MATAPQFGGEKKSISTWHIISVLIVMLGGGLAINPKLRSTVFGGELTSITNRPPSGPPPNNGSAAPLPQTSGPSTNNPAQTAAGPTDAQPADVSKLAPLPLDSTDSKIIQYGPANPLNWDNKDRNHKLSREQRELINAFEEPLKSYVLDLIGTKQPANYFTVRGTETLYLYTARQVVKLYYKAYGLNITDENATALLCQLNGIDLKHVKRDFAFTPGSKVWVKSKNPAIE